MSGGRADWERGAFGVYFRLLAPDDHRPKGRGWMNHHRTRLLTGTVALALVLALAAISVGSSSLAAQDATATVPLETQVWLDLMATSDALNATATYDALLQAAILTLTATHQPPTPGVPATLPATPALAEIGSADRGSLEALQTELVTVPGGTFLMGTTLEEAAAATDECALYGATCELAWSEDALPMHPVTLDAYGLEQTEVSLAQYVTFLNTLGPNGHIAGCAGQRCAITSTENTLSLIDFDGATYSVRNAAVSAGLPASMVTWYGAQAYCAALGRRLPTEAEWEHAARGPENLVYPWGFAFDPARANSSRSGADGSEPVASYADGASPFGLLNMAGNVSEWVADWYADTYYADSPDTNPAGPTSGTQRVVRGGSWDTMPLFLRTVHRMSADPALPFVATGFRCAADVTDAADTGLLAPPPTAMPASPPPTPVPLATPEGGSPLVITALDDAISNDLTPVNPRDVFASPVTRIYAFLAFEDMPSGQTWLYEVFRDGTLVDALSQVWTREASGETFFFFGDSEGLAPGLYHVVLFVGESSVPVDIRQFTVLPEGAVEG